MSEKIYIVNHMLRYNSDKLDYIFSASTFIDCFIAEHGEQAVKESSRIVRAYYNEFSDNDFVVLENEYGGTTSIYTVYDFYTLNAIYVATFNFDTRQWAESKKEDIFDPVPDRFTYKLESLMLKMELKEEVSQTEELFSENTNRL